MIMERDNLNSRKEFLEMKVALYEKKLQQVDLVRNINDIDRSEKIIIGIFEELDNIEHTLKELGDE